MNLTVSTQPNKSIRQRIDLDPILAFAKAQILATFKNKKAFFTMLTPIFMLTLFWLTGRGSSDAELVAQMMFPAIIGFSVMLNGGVQAMRLISWRQQGIFQRLAVTPVPLGHLVFGDLLAQAFLALLQGVITLLFGVIALGLPVNWFGTAVALLILTLAAACFLAYGSLIAAFTNQPEVANSIFIFTLLPMFFAGGGFPPSLMPDIVNQIGAWLPVGLTNKMIVPLLIDGSFHADTAVGLLALVGYTVLFSLIAGRFFKTE